MGYHKACYTCGMTIEDGPLITDTGGWPYWCRDHVPSPRRASEPRPGDRMQSQAAKPEASEADLGQWEDEGGHSGLRA